MVRRASCFTVPHWESLLGTQGEQLSKASSAFQPGLTQKTMPDEEVRTRPRVLVPGLLKQALGVLF